MLFGDRVRVWESRQGGCGASRYTAKNKWYNNKDGEANRNNTEFTDIASGCSWTVSHTAFLDRVGRGPSLKSPPTVSWGFIWEGVNYEQAACWGWSTG